jgi:hypothetical protein
MNCDKAAKTYLKLDNGQLLPFLLRVHLFRCSTCKKFINAYQDSLLQLRKNKYSQTEVDFSDAIMNKIQLLNVPKPHTVKVSNFNWIIAGLFIIAGFISIPFSKYFETLIDHFGIELELPLSIVMGCVITLYSIIFAMTHTSIFNSKIIEKFFQK